VSIPCSSRGGGRCTTIVEDSVEVPVDAWTYDFGPQRFVRFLTFEHGKLIQIDSGGYGHKQS
jgi:hypothetical protein